MALYSDPAAWMWWQVFYAPPRSPLGNLYFQGQHKPAWHSTAMSCCRLGVHLVIPFYSSFLKTHQKGKEMVGRYWFVSLTNLPRCFLARIRVAKCKAKLQSIQEGGVQPQMERRLPGSWSLTHSPCLRLRSQDSALGMPAMEKSVQTCPGRASNSLWLVQQFRQIALPATSVPGGQHWKPQPRNRGKEPANGHWLPLQGFPGNTAIEGWKWIDNARNYLSVKTNKNSGLALL